MALLSNVWKFRAAAITLAMIVWLRLLGCKYTNQVSFTEHLSWVPYLETWVCDNETQLGIGHNWALRTCYHSLPAMVLTSPIWTSLVVLLSPLLVSQVGPNCPSDNVLPVFCKCRSNADSSSYSLVPLELCILWLSANVMCMLVVLIRLPVLMLESCDSFKVITRGFSVLDSTQLKVWLELSSIAGENYL